MLSRLSSFTGPLSKLFTSIKGFTLNGLILRYEIRDKDSYIGTSTVTDLIGNSNATLINGPIFSSNGYLNFDGTNDYLMTNTSLNSKLSPTNTSKAISYFLWIYPQENGVIVTEQGSSSLNTSWHDSQIEMVSGTLKFGLWNGAGISTVTSMTSTSFNKWYYVGLTYDGTILRAYVNTQLVGSLNFTRSTPYEGSAGLHYGIAATDFTNMGDGTYAKMKLGAFHVYNTALSQQQILNNYNAQKSNYIYIENMLIWIDANDIQSYPGSGTTITDLSGNNYTHSLVSGAVYKNLFGVQSFDCSGNLYQIDCSVTGPVIQPSGYTYVTWARMISSNATFRTLFRTTLDDHPLLTNIGTDILGMFDNNTNSFITSNYNVSSLANKWVQWSIVGDSNGSSFYINGDLVGTAAKSASGNTHNIIGNSIGGGQPFGHIGNTMLYNTKLTREQIKQNYDALKHVYEQGNFSTSNLILYFNPANLFSYPGSGSTISDLSGNSLNGTLSNVTFDKDYFIYNGSNSQITINDNSLLEPGTGDWTLEVWINQTVSTGSQVVLGKFDTGGASQDVSYAVRVINGNARVDFGNGVSATSTTNYPLSLGTWYQLTFVFNNLSNNNIITYVNAVEKSTNTHSFSSILNTTSNLYLGSYNNGEYSQWFNGKIGITRIYNSALSYSQILQNFNTNAETYGLERNNPQPVTDGLLLRLDANNSLSYSGSGATWSDISGNGNNMILKNSPTYVSSAISYFDFNGTTQYAQGTGITVPATAYTKSVWFWIDAYADNNILSGGNGTGGHFLFMGSSAFTKIFVGHQNQVPSLAPNFLAYQSTASISLNTWYNVTVTFNTTNGFKIYINGQLDSSHNMTLAHLGSGTTNLASYADIGGNYLNGRISKVYTYNRVLNSDEVLQNFNADRSTFGL